MRADRRFARGTTGTVHHLLHAVVDLVPVGRVAQDDVRHRVFIHRLHPVEGLGQVRTIPDAFVGHQRGGLGQLQRRRLHVALADTENQGFAGEPRLFARCAFPFARRHQARGFFEHVQRDLLADAELVHIGRQPIDAELVRQVIEVGVVGPHDRRVEVDEAVTGTVPVAILVVVVGQHVIARVEHPARSRDHAGVETGNRYRRFDRRARRVQTTQHAVEQRPVDGITQLGVGLEADAGDEQVGVETRLTDHRQHFAGFRIERHHRATTPAQCGLGGFLQLDVEAQDDVLAGNRIGALEHPQHAATGVGFDFLVTDLTVQFRLVEPLDAGLADVVGAAVVDRIQRLQLFLVDPPHVAHRVRKVRALRVMPDQLRDHFHPGQAELVHRDPGDLLFGQLEQYWHRLERPAPLTHAFLEDHPVLGRQLQHLDDDVEHLLPIAGALAGHAQTEARPVVGHDYAVAVENQPARRRNRLHMDAVVFRQGRVVLVLDHLQVIQTRDQHTDQRHDHDRTEHDTAAHQTGVLFVVLDADRLRHEGRLTCGKGGRTTRSRHGTTVRRSGSAPAGAARSAATMTSAGQRGHRLPVPALPGRRP